MKQWEYKVIKFKGQPGTDQEHDMLSEQGANGWELCTIYIGVMYYYFKRQLP